MSDSLPHQECLILDACCVINLYASGYMQPILEAFPKSVAVAAYVYQVETMRVYSDSMACGLMQYEAINLDVFINNNYLQVIHPTEHEEDIILRLSSAALESGEAMTAAIAVHRMWSLGTDDKAAIAYLKQKVPELQVISTLDIIKLWVDTADPPFTHVRGVLDNIQRRARYQPHRQHPLYAWWKQYQIKCN